MRNSHGWSGRLAPTFRFNVSFKTTIESDSRTSQRGKYLGRWYGCSNTLVLDASVLQHGRLAGTLGYELTHGVLDVMNDHPAVDELDRDSRADGGALEWFTCDEQHKIVYRFREKLEAKRKLRYGLVDSLRDDPRDATPELEGLLNLYRTDVATSNKGVREDLGVRADEVLSGAGSLPDDPLAAPDVRDLVDRIRVKSGFTQ